MFGLLSKALVDKSTPPNSELDWGPQIQLKGEKGYAYPYQECHRTRSLPEKISPQGPFSPQVPAVTQLYMVV